MQMMLSQEQEEKLQKLCKQQKLTNKKLLQLAEGEASRFVSIYTMSISKAKDVTQERMYLRDYGKSLS